MAEINKRNLIKSKYPKAKCIRVKGRQIHYLVNLGDANSPWIAVATTPLGAWARAYEKLIEKGGLK